MKDPINSTSLNELVVGQNYLDRKAFVLAVQTRVAQLLTDQPDLLFSFLYRLDVDEGKIQLALKLKDRVDEALAELIVDRQLERIKTKEENKDKGVDWNWEVERD